MLSCKGAKDASTDADISVKDTSPHDNSSVTDTAPYAGCILSATSLLSCGDVCGSLMSVSMSAYSTVESL